MTDRQPLEDVPEQVLRLMGRLERFTGRMPMGQVVSAIVVLGMLLTALMTGAVWWAERYRQDQAFRAEALSVQAQVQDRLSHRLLQLHQMSSLSWMGGGAQAEPAWLPEDVIRLVVHQASARQSHSLLLQCLARQQAGEQTRFCPTVVRSADAIGALAAPVPGRDGEWLVWSIKSSALWPPARMDSAWQIAGRFLLNGEPGDAGSTDRAITLSVSSAGQITITINGGSQTQVGTVAVGSVFDLGMTLHGLSLGVLDYSSKQTSAFGVTSVFERPFAKRMEASVVMKSWEVDEAARRLQLIRAKPVVWIGGVRFDQSVVYGFLKDWAIDIAYADSSNLTLTIEGLI